MKINNYFGWHSLFYDTFIYRRSIAKPINFGFIAYKDVVCHNILNLKKVLVLTFLILIITINRKKKITKSHFIFSLIIFFTILSKIFLFPISQTRFYIPFLLVGYFNLIINKSKKLKSNSKK